MTGLRASGSSTNLPAYCLASCVPDDSPYIPRSKRVCFQSIFETSGDTCEEYGSQDFFHQPEKKRRLTPEQVRSLEKKFELENKLEPERKFQIAHELGLQPRQVAIWFQNRRARWKTKKLEMDYDTLKSDYISLKAKYDVLLKEKERIETEMMCLKEALQLPHSERLEGREESERLELNGTSSLLDSKMMEKEAEVKVQLETSMEDQPVQPLMEDGSSMSDLDASEMSNTSSPRFPGTDACEVTRNVVPAAAAAAAATCFLLSNLNSKHQSTALPHFLSESLLKKVQSATIKVEPEKMHCQTASCNFIVEADEEGDIPWWDWGYYNFCT